MAKDIRVTLELDNKQFNRAINQSKGQVDSFKKDSVDGLGAIKTALIAVGGAAVTKSIVDVGARFQDLQNSLNVVFGSVEEGAKQFDRITDFASGTQFSVETLTQAFVQLKGAGVEPTDRLLKIFADTASVTTDQMGTFQAALDLVSRSTAGGLGLEDLNRLADRGIPVFNILQEKLGLTRLEVSEFGKTAEGANRIIDALTRGLEERFGGALSSSSDNVSRLTNNLGDALDKLQASIFNLISDDLGNGLKNLTNLIENLATAIDNLNEAGFTLGGILKTIALGIIFLINPVGKVRAAIGGMITAVKSVGKNFRNTFVHLGLDKAVGTLANVFERLGSTILGLLGINALFKDNTEEVSAAVKNNAHVLAFEQEQARLNEEAAKANAKQKELNKIAEDAFAKGLNSATTAIKEQTSAFDKNDPLSSYQELLSEVLGTANDTAVQQIFASKAIKAVTDMYENGLIPLRTYNLALQQLKGLTGASPFADFEDSLEGITLTTTEYAEKQRQLNALIEKYPEFAEEAARAQDILDEAFGENEGLASFLQTLGTAQKRLSDDLATALLEGEKPLEAFRDFFKTIISQILADILRLMIIQPILSSIFGAFGMPITFGPGGSITRKKAVGGPVMKDTPYIVGERGPEMFVPNSAGSIMRNDQMGMGGAVTYNIQAVDARSFQQLVASDPEFIFSVTEAGRRRIPGRF